MEMEAQLEMTCHQNLIFQSHPLSSVFFWYTAHISKTSNPQILSTPFGLLVVSCTFQILKLFKFLIQFYGRELKRDKGNIAYNDNMVSVTMAKKTRGKEAIVVYEKQFQ